MDTGTHIITGIAIGVVGQSILKIPNEWTIYLTAIISSIIPDADVLFKIKSNNLYVLNHRGLSHTIVLLPLLALISPLLCLPFNDSFFQLFVISLISIAIHLFLDVLNPYGTKLMPKKRDYQLNVIYTFDPIFFSILVIGTIISLFHIYIIILEIFAFILYFVLRVVKKNKIINSLRNQYPESKKIFALSKADPLKWHIIIEFDDSYIVGIYYKKLIEIDKIPKSPIPGVYFSSLITNKTYQAFIRKSIAHIFQKTDDGFMLYDLKYRKKGFYYFRAYFTIKDNKITNSYLGWVFKEEKFIEKLKKENVK